MAALAIGDRIERFVDLGIGSDWLVDRASSQQRVGAHRREAFGQSAGLDIEIGAPLIADPVAHPVGKAFVEPDVIPPRRGHQIAEPLMRQLMRHNHAESALLAGRSLVIHDEDGIIIQVRPGILHRPGHDR